MAPSLSSTDLNYLVFRYLQESGFTHSGFVFGNEAKIDKISTIDRNLVPPGALITLVQKGLLYIELEANNDDTNADLDFSFLTPMDLITKDVDELQKMVGDRKKITQKVNVEKKEKHVSFKQQVVKRKTRD